MSDEVINHKLSTLHEDVGEMKTALNRLTDAVTKLALLEERQANAAAALERAFMAIERVEERLKRLELHLPASKRVNEWVDRSVVFALGLMVMYVVKKVGLG